MKNPLLKTCERCGMEFGQLEEDETPCLCRFCQRDTELDEEQEEPNE